MRRRRLFGLLGAAALAAPVVALVAPAETVAAPDPVPGSVALGDGPDDSMVVTGSASSRQGDESTEFVPVRIGSNFYRISVYSS